MEFIATANGRDYYAFDANNDFVRIRCYNWASLLETTPLKKGDKTMCMYNLALNDELVKRTRQSFANEADMTAWLQRQVEALMIEYNTSQQTVRRSARAAIAAMRRQSELNGNAEMSLQDINTEIQQARLSKKTTAQ